jgi:hypothetical protein
MPTTPRLARTSDALGQVIHIEAGRLTIARAAAAGDCLGANVHGD